MAGEITHKLYLDDSGQKNYLSNPDDYSRGGTSRYFALGAVLMPTKAIAEFQRKIIELKLEYFNDDSVEIKSNWIRNKKERTSQYIDKYEITPVLLDNFASKINDCFFDDDIFTLGAIVDKTKMHDLVERSKSYTTLTDTVSLALECLAQRVQDYLKPDEKCSFTMDIMSTNAESRRIAKSYKSMIENNGNIVKFELSRIASRLIFADSKANHMVQLADLVAYNIFRQYKKHGNPFDGSRFDDTNYYHLDRLLPKTFLRDSLGSVDGYGLTSIPLGSQPAWHNPRNKKSDSA